MKELNIIEAIKMPVGTEFTIKPSIVSCSCPNVFINGDKGEKVLVLKNKELVPTAESILSAKFIPIQKPVSFMEAVTSGKNISYRHEEAIFSEGNFGDIYDVLETLIECNSKDSIIKILSSECWYIED